MVKRFCSNLLLEYCNLDVPDITNVETACEEVATERFSKSLRVGVGSKKLLTVFADGLVGFLEKNLKADS